MIVILVCLFVPICYNQIMKTKIIDLQNLENFNLNDCLSNGDIIAYPTDTIYGLGCSPYLDNACHNIMEIKNRPSNKSLIVLISKDFDISQIADIDKKQKDILSKIWPNSVTVLLKPNKDANLSSLVTNNGQSIAVRRPSGEIINKILDKVKILTSTSCNLSSMPILNDVLSINQTFGGKIDYIIDGGKNINGEPSTILDLRNGIEIVRVGVVDKTNLEKLIYG